jgi:TolB-like protein/DNA-binding winged helix-turn-helix (wHTH) protein/tetratricopeptide (TPR) repeat protein
MQSGERADGRLSFGVFEVDLRAGELRKRGLRVRLQQQPFQVLAMLLERRGDVVSREELQQALWPANTFVDFDHGLNKAINKIREALGDSAAAPRFIETVAKRGYRFLADVRVADGRVVEPAPVAAADLPAAPATPAARRTPISARTWVIAAAVAVVLLGALALSRFHGPTSSKPPIRSLAVLPLESLSPDASQDYFADGMTDELISHLGQISALRVISRTSMMGYKHTRKQVPEIARELAVDAIIEGTVLRSDDRVRITAQLIDGVTDRHIWSDSYEGEVRNTLTLQNNVARAIADQIRVNLNPQEQAALRGGAVLNPAAYESYLKGRFFWNKRTANGLKTALEYFKQAIEEDPAYARAYSGLADTYALLGDWQYAVLSPKEALPKAKAAAMKAVELDATLGEAHTSLAFCLDGFDWDFQAAGKEFQRAIELTPAYATGHHWYAWHLALERRYDEALVEMRKAQNLDPLSLVINADLAELLALAHAYDDSITQSLKTLELDPAFGLAHNHLGEAYLQKHLNKQAIAELQKAVSLSGGGATSIANLARAYAASGRTREAVDLLNDLKSRSSPLHSYASEIAVIYAALGDARQAMDWLERGAAERFNPGVLLRPGLDPLRSEPRFVDLMRRVGLSP